MPTHWPMTFTNTSRAFLPTTCWPVRFRTVMLVLALPLVALPTAVLADAFTAPEVAVADVSLAIAWIAWDVLLVAVVLEFASCAVLIVVRGTLLASRAWRVSGGSKM